MDSLLKNICDLFLENKYKSHGNYTIGKTQLDDLVAYIFTLNDRKMDHDVMMEQYNYLYRNEINASFRDCARMPLMCYMAMSEDPDAYFKQVESIYNRCPKLGFCNYEVDAAIMIQNSKPNEVEHVIERTYDMYNRLKKAHPYNTGKYSFPRICICVMSERSMDDLMADFEACYKYMKPFFSDGTYYQNRALYRVYGEGQSIEKCKKIEAVRNLLNKKKHSLGGKSEVETLDLFASRPESVETIVDLIIEVDDYLKPNKDFHGFLSFPEHRRMDAALLVHKYLLDKARIGSEPSVEERIVRSQAVYIVQEIIFTDSYAGSVGND